MNTSYSQDPTAEEESRYSNVAPAHASSRVDAGVIQSASLPGTDNVADTEDPALPSDGAEVDIAATLTGLQPSARVRKVNLFREHYQQIEAALARGVTQGGVRAALKKGGLSLSAATFRKMLDAERLRNQPTSDEQAPSAAKDLPSVAFAEAGGV